jgi:hypothetical protein
MLAAAAIGGVAVRKTGLEMSEGDQRLWGYVGEKGHDVNGAFDPTRSTGFGSPTSWRSG